MKQKILNNGQVVDEIGFGTYLIPTEKCFETVVEAIKCGYRHFDTAQSYFNEEYVGAAISYCIQAGIVKREDLFITTKINPHEPMGYQEAINAIESSLEKLGLDYIDLYLIHYPNLTPGAKWKKINAETWKAFEECYDKGLIKGLGVSNFLNHHLEELLKVARIKPVCNQLNLSPIWQQKEVVEFCNKHNIQCVAWAPLVRNIEYVQHILDIPNYWDDSDDWTKETMDLLAKKYNKSKEQIAIKWSLQKGFIPLVKTTQKGRMLQNLDVYDFVISDEDMNMLDDLNSRPTFPSNTPDCISLIWAFGKKDSKRVKKEKDVINLFGLQVNLKNNGNTNKWLLFNKIPLLKIKKKNNSKTKYFLFGFIPLLKTYTVEELNGFIKKYYLFGFIKIGNRYVKTNATYSYNLLPDYRQKESEYKKYTNLKDRLFNKIFTIKELYDNKKQKCNYKKSWLRYKLTKKVPIALLDVHLTTACSFKCKDCSHCIPYYKHENYHVMSLEEFKNELDVILKNVDRIYNLLLLGGEPLLNKDLSEIVKYAESKKQVLNIGILTNGSLLPNETLLNTLKETKKTMVCISSYDLNKGLKNYHAEEIVDILKKNNIKFYYQKGALWWKQPKIDLKVNNAKKEYIEDNFAKCNLKYCTLWSNGKIYPCAPAKYINDEKQGVYNSNFIDLRKKNLSPTDFRKFFDVSMYNVCECCDMTHYGEPILPAIQIEQKKD